MVRQRNRRIDFQSWIFLKKRTLNFVPVLSVVKRKCTRIYTLYIFGLRFLSVLLLFKNKISTASEKTEKKFRYAVSRYAVTPLPVTPLRVLLTTLIHKHADAYSSDKLFLEVH